MDSLGPVAAALRRAAMRVALNSCAKHVSQAFTLSLCAACVLVIFARLALQSLPPLGVLAALVLLLPASASVWCLSNRPTAQRMAKVLDDRLDLRDRLSSAVEFAALRDKPEAVLAQLADAVRCAGRVNLTAALPITVPRESKAVFLAAVTLLALMAYPMHVGRTGVTTTNGTPIGAEQATEIKGLSEEHLKHADKLGSEELRRLAQEFADLADKLQKGLLDRKQALAMLSQLVSEVERSSPSAARAQLAQQLKTLAEALSRSDRTREIAKALDRGDLSKASEQLKSLSDDLKQGQLSKAEQEELARALSQGGSNATQPREGRGEPRSGPSGREKTQSLIRDLAERISQAERDKALSRFHRDLEMAKAHIAMGARQKEGDGLPGWGRGKGGLQAGFGPSNAPQGDVSRIEGKTVDERAKGVPGPGPTAEEATLRAQRDDTRSGRPYREVYAQYRKLMEEALEREDIPLGYRHLVKRYFEAIKPREDQP